MPKLNTVRVPQLAWHGDTEFELQFPSSWGVTTCYMRGHDSPRLSEEAIAKAFHNPIGSKPLRELAGGKKEVAIIFDDMTRPTRVAELVWYVLEELKAAGVPDDGIRFVAAVGAHGALNRMDFASKLGEEVVDRFPVYNHNPYENCSFVGETSQGTPVWINSEVMSCDLKIGIGCIVPHTLAGFGGGGKIILPGVASVDTIQANHALADTSPPGASYGKIEENALRLDVDEAAMMAGLDVKIDAIVNIRRETTALFVGEPAAEHREGVKLAKDFYATQRVEDADIVVANLYAKADEAGLFVPPTAQLLPERGGDLVLIMISPVGQVIHYLLRSFGKNIGGRRWFPRASLPARANRLIVLAPYGERAGGDWIGPPESIIWAKTWIEVLEELKTVYGDRAKVAVIPDATMQYFPR